MVTENKLTINFGSEANQSRKKRGAEEVEDVDHAKTTKKQKLDRDLFLSSQCFKVLRSMREHRFGWRFDELVIDNRDYFSVISTPMDFVTIISKLAKNLYRNSEDEFPEDVRLVFVNAMLYYPPESSVHKNAMELKKFFEIRWESEKKKLAYEYSEIEVDRLKQSRPETSEHSSWSFSLAEKVSLSTNPMSEQRKSDQNPKGFVVPISSERALRAATIKIRFADTIVKAKYRKLIDESNNKADVMMRIEKEKKLLEESQLEEKAIIEAEIRAPVLTLRHKGRLALEKMKEEACRSKIESNLEAEQELVNLCGGSRLARTRWIKWFGLFLKRDDDCLEEIERKAYDDREEGEII